MRLFIASPVRLENYQKIMDDFSEVIEGKWVKEENLHMTWLFLGEHKDATLFEECLQHIAPLPEKIRIKGMGYFGRPPKIFYANVKGKAVFEKAKMFEKRGFETGRFRPHITLCRIKRILDYAAYKKRVKIYRNRVLGEVLPDIILYESRLSHEGAQYIEIMKSGQR